MERTLTFDFRGWERIKQLEELGYKLTGKLRTELRQLMGKAGLEVGSLAQDIAPVGPSRSDPDYPGLKRRKSLQAQRKSMRKLAKQGKFWFEDAADVITEQLSKTGWYSAGSLRRSEQVDVQFRDQAAVVAIVTFGGLAAHYVEVQHENKRFKHPVHSATGAVMPSRAHFLYGDDSAWEKKRVEIMGRINTETEEIARRMVREVGNA
jgi:hypothetical protein